MDPNDSLPATQETKKDETRNRPRISLYTWLGQRQENQQRKVTFQTEERPDKESAQVKESKEEEIEVSLSNYMNPQVSATEMNEYER